MRHKKHQKDRKDKEQKYSYYTLEYSNHNLDSKEKYPKYIAKDLTQNGSSDRPKKLVIYIVIIQINFLDFY